MFFHVTWPLKSAAQTLKSCKYRPALWFRTLTFLKPWGLTFLCLFLLVLLVYFWIPMACPCARILAYEGARMLPKLRSTGIMKLQQWTKFYLEGKLIQDLGIGRFSHLCNVLSEHWIVIPCSRSLFEVCEHIHLHTTTMWLQHKLHHLLDLWTISCGMNHSYKVQGLHEQQTFTANSGKCRRPNLWISEMLCKCLQV